MPSRSWGDCHCKIVQNAKKDCINGAIMAVIALLSRLVRPLWPLDIRVQVRELFWDVVLSIRDQRE